MASFELARTKEQAALALACIKRREYVEAEAIYRKLMASGDIDSSVLSNLALLCGMNGRIDERLHLLGRAISIDPSNALAHLNLGVAYQEQDDLTRAIACYWDALRLKPDLPEAHSNLGFALLLSGDYEAAFSALSEAILLKPDYVEAIANFAQLMVVTDDDAAAVEAYRRCLELEPDSVRYRFALGCVLNRLSKVDEAIESFEQCLLIEAHRSDIIIELCSVLRRLGRADDAIIRLLPCLAADPDNTDVMLLYAKAIHDIGSADQAIDILNQALAVNPDNVDCLNHLGMYLQDCGRTDDAVSSYERALRINPANAAVLGNLATAYRIQGRYEDALKLFHDAIAAEPSRRSLYHGLLFHYSIGSEAMAKENLAAACTYWKLVRDNVPSVEKGIPAMERNMKRKQDLVKQKGRIAILSAELGNHCVSMFLGPLLENFNRRLFEVDVISVSRMYHERARVIASMVNDSYSLQGLDLTEARRVIQQRSYDVIIETSGFTLSSGIEILAERCAPVQAHYIGYHASTGLDTMDYFIGDEETVPEEFASQFSETLWRLPRPWLACSPLQSFPKAISEATKPIPVIGSFNQLSKIREDTLSYWAAVMQRLPTSVLVVKDKAVNSAFAVERIKSTLEGFSIDPKRLFFLGPSPSLEAHLLHYNILDVALDATPWSSATTAFDALAMGVPLVAIRGGCTSARMSSSLLKGIGKDDWIASSPNDYAEAVAHICSDLPLLRSNRALRQREVLGSVLFDGRGMAAVLETAFSDMIDDNS